MALGRAGIKYATIVADPPWDYRTPGQIGKTLDHRPNRDRGMSKHGAGSAARYGAMNADELARLPVADRSEGNAHLYLWTTNGFMEQAYPLARAWGFEPKTILTWTKTRHADGQPSMKMGYYYRGATEHCLFCVRGSLRLRGPAHSTAILVPRTPHSVKPGYFYDLVEAQSPGPYLEMFARTRRLGWDAWGNEIAA
jgi:N6-adenosine-specific RNA methylase IME4